MSDSLRSSAHEIFQARILEQVATSCSRGASRPRDPTPVSWVSYIGRQILYQEHHLGKPNISTMIFFSCSFLTLDISWIISGSFAKHKTQDSRRNSLTPKLHGSHNFFVMWCYHQLLQSDTYFVSVPSFHPIWLQVDAFLISVPPTLQISFFLSPAKCCYLNSCHWYPAHLPLWENKFNAYSPF